MIFVENKDIREEDFANLLESTRAMCLDSIRTGNTTGMTGVEFEHLVYESMLSASQGSVFEGDIVQTGTQSFPDIIASKYFGIEVKTTTADKWTSTGNSVLEGTRVGDVGRIYMFFGKFGGGIDIRYRLYQECLHEVGVTHSPRYKIDMNLANGQSIFDKMRISYDELRKSQNPIQVIKDYYRQLLKEGEELWWVDQAEGESASPIIRSFSTFADEDKIRFRAEAMILFPEIFGTSTLKFERVAIYLMTQHNAISSNIRDHFTAGGTGTMIIGDNSFENIPRIVMHLSELAERITTLLGEIEADTLKQYWKVDIIEDNRIGQWLSMIDSYSKDADYALSDAFYSKLHT